MSLNPIKSSMTNGVVWAIPSMYKVRPLGTVLKVRFTFCGQMMTEVVLVNPEESFTARVNR